MVSGAKDLMPRMRNLFSCYNQCYLTLLVNQFSETKNFRETIERTISSEDVEIFSKLTGDYNTLHTASVKRPAVVHGALLNGIVSGVIGTKLPGHGTVVISQTLRFPKYCHVGDTVLVSVEIQELRKIMSCKYQVINKHSKDVVLEGEAKLLFKNPALLKE